MDELTGAQRKAIAAVERRALEMRPAAQASIDATLRAASTDADDYREAMQRLRGEVKVVLAFHPERLSRGGQSVAQGLLADGVYRTQFETGLSSGSTSALAGGARDEWERRLFQGTYHDAGVALSERPKYGALFLVAHPDGPAPRFGSCYFVLRPEVSARCTFSLLGSQEDRAPEQTGTLDVIEPMMAALLDHVAGQDAPLGVRGLTVRALIEAMREGVPCTPRGVSPDRLGRALDSFVEAQVHGSVDLKRDVEALVADAAFRGTPVADVLAGMASMYDIALAWHPGFALPVDEVPETFRDYPTRSLAERIAPGAIVTAPVIGAASNDFVLNPEAWRAFGTPSEIHTCFRRLWHALVLLGRPFDAQIEAGGSRSGAG